MKLKSPERKPKAFYKTPVKIIPTNRPVEKSNEIFHSHYPMSLPAERWSGIFRSHFPMYLQEEKLNEISRMHLPSYLPGGKLCVNPFLRFPLVAIFLLVSNKKFIY